MGPIRAPSLETFQTFAEAIRHRVAVRMRYHTQSRNEDTERIVEAYHLHNHKGDWYLIAFCRMRGTVRDFLLSRVLQAERLDEPFDVPDDFDFATYAAQSFDIEKGGTPTKVAVWFDAYQARWIRERRWHPTQRIVEHDDGSLTIEFEAAGLDEVARWVLSYGEHATVRRPSQLRQRVAQALSLAAANYDAPQESGRILPG